MTGVNSVIFIKTCKPMMECLNLNSFKLLVLLRLYIDNRHFASSMPAEIIPTHERGNVVENGSETQLSLLVSKQFRFDNHTSIGQPIIAFCLMPFSKDTSLFFSLTNLIKQVGG